MSQLYSPEPIYLKRNKQTAYLKPRPHHEPFLKSLHLKRPERPLSADLSNGWLAPPVTLSFFRATFKPAAWRIVCIFNYFSLNQLNQWTNCPTHNYHPAHQCRLGSLNPTFNLSLGRLYWLYGGGKNQCQRKSKENDVLIWQKQINVYFFCQLTQNKQLWRTKSIPPWQAAKTLILIIS